MLCCYPDQEVYETHEEDRKFFERIKAQRKSGENHHSSQRVSPQAAQTGQVEEIGKEPEVMIQS